MAEFPPPLTPPESDLRDFQFMPLDVVRLAQSDLVAFEEPAAVVAAILLWGASWHGKPAGSLTNDDRALAKAAGYGRGIGEWLAVKDGALRGFVLCSDGRLYHPVVAEKVRDAWDAKLHQRHRTFGAAVRKHNERNPHDQRTTPSFEVWCGLGRPKEVAALSAPARQQRLALDGENGSDPVDAEVMSHATPDNVTRDKGGVSREQELHVTRDSGSKGEGRDREGTGKGDSYKKHATPDAPAEVRKREIDPFDVMKVADQLARRAGVPHSQPTQIATNLDMVRQWQGDGIDLAIVEEEIDRFRLDKPDQRVSVLRFFDTGVRARIAAKEVKARKGKDKPFHPTMAAPPTAPLKAADEDDDRVRRVRTILNGNPTITPDKVAFSIGDDEGEPILVATCRSPFVKANLDMEPIRHAARDVTGSGNVEVRVQ